MGVGNRDLPIMDGPTFAFQSRTTLHVQYDYIKRKKKAPE